MLFRRTDLPLDRDPSGRFLPWLVALMVYLAALALVCAMAMAKMVERWDTGLSGTITVQVPPPETGPPGAQEAAIDRVIKLLLDTKAVRSAEVLEPDEIAALLEPWLGAGATYGELPLPTLISVGINPAAAPDYQDLARRLAEAAPGTVLDDHQNWLGQLLDLAQAIELVAALIVILVGASAVAMVIFATRMGLAIHGRVIELLHLIGAQDAYVAREFETHALKLALRGGAVGLLLAIATVTLVSRLFERLDSVLLPELTLSPIEWAALAMLPLAIALVAMLTARFTVLGNLGRMH
ncbi:MAG: cell division protein FtsX [Alphaproteobacteria bacterium]